MVLAKKKKKRQPKTRHIDWWNRIDPHLYSQLIFDRRSKYIQLPKDSLFNQWCWENWTDTCRKMKLDHLLTPHMRINSKWNKDLNVRPETTEILEESIGSKISHIIHRNFYWIYLPRQGKQKKKINKWNYIKLKSFCRAKEAISKKKRSPQNWRIYLPIYIW